MGDLSELAAQELYHREKTVVVTELMNCTELQTPCLAAHTWGVRVVNKSTHGSFRSIIFLRQLCASIHRVYATYCRKEPYCPKTLLASCRAYSTILADYLSVDLNPVNARPRPQSPWNVSLRGGYTRVI